MPTLQMMEQGLAHILGSPRDKGRLEMVVRRPTENLAGNQLLGDLDLSEEALPPGGRLRVEGAVAVGDSIVKLGSPEDAS